MSTHITKEQLERRLTILSQIAQSLNDELVKLGYGDGVDVNEENSGLLGKCITDLFILADTRDDHADKFFMTDEEVLSSSNTISNKYSVAYRVVYRSYSWMVIDKTTNKGIVCFPTQIGAWNWISQQQSK